LGLTGLIILLVVLILLSGFFACAETALMSVNKYQLRHKARSGNPVAGLILRLLERPDRLLGVILIGNTGANIIASSVATIICVKVWGSEGVFIATIGLTFVVLIFSEVSPKTYAALHPMGVAKWVSWPLYTLQILLYPFVWVANMIANGFLYLLGVRVSKKTVEALTAEELRTIVHESGEEIPNHHQDMLLGVLDLAEVTVNDIMIPRSEIIGIDLDADWNDTIKLLMTSQHTRLPVYKGSLDDVKGILHLREALHLMAQNRLSSETLQQVLYETYYVPSKTSLNVQLLNFRKIKRRSAIIVDEYGDVQGLVTLEDILEEIVGEFTTNFSELNADIYPQKDGTYIINGSISVRSLNRELEWNLPVNKAKTLSGLIIEYLETIPKYPVCLKIKNYCIEVKKINDNLVKTVRIHKNKTIECGAKSDN
jgi:Mg2+/Co2+ transporter CorB